MKLNLYGFCSKINKTQIKIAVFGVIVAFLAILSGLNPVEANSSYNTGMIENQVLASKDELGIEKYICEKDIIASSISNPKLELYRLGELCNNGLVDEAKNDIKIEPSELQNEISAILENTPMEAMVEDISKKERIVAAFLVGIALKESSLGVHSPRKSGRDCFNYWGYKGNTNPTSDGYSCFESPKQAVEVVGGRINDLVTNRIDTPSEMLVWKCGSSCANHDPGGVAKWVSDVSIYFNQLKS